MRSRRAARADRRPRTGRRAEAPRAPGEELGRQRVTLADAVDALACAAAREKDAVLVVEDDDGLAALLDERSRPYRVGVHREGSNRRFARRLRSAHEAQTHMSVNPTRHLPRRGEMGLKAFALTGTVLGALVIASVAAAAVYQRHTGRRRAARHRPGGRDSSVRRQRPRVCARRRGSRPGRLRRRRRPRCGRRRPRVRRTWQRRARRRQRGGPAQGWIRRRQRFTEAMARDRVSGNTGTGRRQRERRRRTRSSAAGARIARSAGAATTSSTPSRPTATPTS